MTEKPIGRADSGQRSLPKDLAVCLLACMALVGGLLYILGSWQSGSWWPPFSDGSQIDWEPTARVAITAAAVLGAVAAAVVAWHGQLTREHELGAKRDADLGDRYSKAIDQLASERESVRLGGLYALERLMGDSPRDVAPIREVLAAHARMWFAGLDRSSVTSRHRVRLAEEVRTCMKILARTWSRDQDSYDLRAIDATGVDLSGADLRRADLRDARLERALLLHADLGGADLARVVATEAVFANAIAPDANFAGATLASAVFTDADVSRADFRNSDVRRARLVRATLASADLARTNLKGANLAGADLRQAQLRRTQLNRADCRGANFGSATFLNANLAGANMRSTNLEDAELVGNNNLTDADFTDAGLVASIDSDDPEHVGAIHARLNDLKRENRSWKRATWTNTPLESGLHS